MLVSISFFCSARTQAMCLLANRIFVLSSQKHLGIKLQTANTLRKDAMALSRGAYSAGAPGAVCANAHAYAIFSAPWRSKRMHGIVGERERSNCVVDMRCIYV